MSYYTDELLEESLSEFYLTNQLLQIFVVCGCVNVLPDPPEFCNSGIHVNTDIIYVI